MAITIGTLIRRKDVTAIMHRDSASAAHRSRVLRSARKSRSVRFETS
jgi:hypothetical protein